MTNEDYVARVDDIDAAFWDEADDTFTQQSAIRTVAFNGQDGNYIIGSGDDAVETKTLKAVVFQGWTGKRLRGGEKSPFPDMQGNVCVADNEKHPPHVNPNITPEERALLQNLGVTQSCPTCSLYRDHRTCNLTLTLFGYLGIDIEAEKIEAVRIKFSSISSAIAVKNALSVVRRNNGGVLHNQWLTFSHERINNDGRNYRRATVDIGELLDPALRDVLKKAALPVWNMLKAPIASPMLSAPPAAPRKARFDPDDIPF